MPKPDSQDWIFSSHRLSNNREYFAAYPELLQRNGIVLCLRQLRFWCNDIMGNELHSASNFQSTIFVLLHYLETL